MKRQLKLMDESGKTHKVNVQDIKITYPVEELIKCLPDDKTFGCAAKYHAHPKHLEDLHLSLNSNALPDIQDPNTGYPCSTTNIDQISHNMSVPATLLQGSHTGTYEQLHMPKSNSNHAHTYNLYLQKTMTHNK